MRPDSRLYGLAGLTAQAGTVSDGYLAVNAAVEPGAGITDGDDAVPRHRQPLLAQRRHRGRDALLQRHRQHGAAGRDAAQRRDATAARSRRSPSTSPGRSSPPARATRPGPARTGTGPTPNRSERPVLRRCHHRLGQPRQGAHPAGRRAAAAARQPGRPSCAATGCRCRGSGTSRATHKAVVVATGDDHGTGGTRRAFQHLRGGQPGRLLGGEVGVPTLHVVRLPEHPDDQHAGGVVPRPGLRGRPPPGERLRQLHVAGQACRTSTRRSWAPGARSTPRCRRRPRAATTASSGATGPRSPRRSWPSASGSTPTTTTARGPGWPTGPAS